MKDITPHIAQLSAELESAPRTATSRLVSLIKEAYLEKNLYFKALVLRNNFLQSGNEYLPEHLKEDYAQLLKEISQAGKPEILPKASASIPIEVPAMDVFIGANIGKTYPGFELKGIGLRLKTGEITALVGENASGKSTLIEIIAGALQPDAGQTEYPVFETKNDAKDWRKIRTQIAYVQQEFISWNHSLLETLHFEAAVHGIHGEENELEVQFIIHRLGLQEHINKSWSQLSGGYKLRFELARALVWHPSLLILDEPLANLDVNTQSIILEDIRDLAKNTKYPVAILISSQHLTEIEGIADRLIYLHKGVAEFNARIADLAKGAKSHLFELECRAPMEAIAQALKGLQLAELFSKGGKYVLRTGPEVSQAMVLSNLVDAGITIISFRDLTASSKKFFYENKEEF
ncbi:MAG: ABC transporter ATP-binding protein [Phaeodactylibacter sp.]|nr:ABC transporter ATP-binding protein [Phaeodactylibacter sp.]